MEAISQKVLESWISSHYKPEQIMLELQAKGYDENYIHTCIEAFKKALNSRRQFNSILLLGTGAFIGFVGCVLSLINPFPDYYYWILYGSTAVAACIIFAGLYTLLEP
ncbi:MAG: hypothetical protein WED33_12555 [Bacteroidia bacterium]